MFKAFIRSLTPPLLWNALHRIRRGPSRPDPVVKFEGNYSSWEEVMQHCGKGYADPSILDRVVQSARRARDSQVAYEADSQTSNTPSYRYPILYVLGQVALKSPQNPWVLDFGGSLGSSYFQHRKMLDSFPELKWVVVEQEHFTALGKKEFEDGRLVFSNKITDLAQSKPSLTLLSSSLTYLKDPHSVFRQLLGLKADYIFIDRLNLIEGADRLTLQTVPPKIYSATYPCWFLNREKLMTTCLEHYTLEDEMEASDVHILDGKSLKSKGYLFKLI